MYAASNIHFVNKYGNSIYVRFIWLQANDIKLLQAVIANYHPLICESNILPNQSTLDKITRLDARLDRNLDKSKKELIWGT